jgi:site-specific DNA recombinase
MNTPIRAVAYYRKSNDDDKELGESIAQQSSWAKEAAAKAGVVLVSEFRDQSVSGLKTAGRTEFAALIKFCEEQARLNNPIRAIVCWHPNRFSRADSLETAAVLFRLREAGVTRMLTATKWIDFARSEDRMLFGLEQEANSHRYSKDLGEAVLRGRKALAKKGKWCGGPAPYGYEYEPGGEKLTLHPEQAQWVKWLFETYLAKSLGVKKLCEMLAENNVPTQKGLKTWSRTAVRGILKNPVYTGTLVYNQRTESPFAGAVEVNVTKGRRHNPREEWVTAPDAHPAIITQELFDAVQKKLSANRTNTAPLKENRFLLSGLMRCGHCGGPMIGRTLTSGKAKRISRRYYQCSRYNSFGRAHGCNPNYVREDMMLSAVVKKLGQAYFNPTVLEALKKEIRSREAASGNTVSERVLTARLARLDESIKTAAKRLMTEDESLVEECRAVLIDLKEQRAKTATELDSARTRAATTEDLDAKVERIMGRLARLETVLKKADPADARALLAEMIDRIELHFNHKTTSRHVRSEFARGLIYVNPSCLLVTDLDAATICRSRSAR